MNEEREEASLNIPAKHLPIKPITLPEIEDDIKKRISLIDHEFLRGFEFIKDQPRTVTFFGSARFAENNIYYQQARRIAYKLSTLGYSVITGGGPGIMEGANRGAFEAGGHSLGLNIKLPMEQSQNGYLTDTIDFYYFFIRKVIMSFSAEAYIFLPGGFGTLDELFEILTLVQTGKIEKVPIILVGEAFWKKVDGFIREELLEKLKAVDEQDLSLYSITDDEEKIISIIERVPVRSGMHFTHEHEELKHILNENKDISEEK